LKIVYVSAPSTWVRSIAGVLLTLAMLAQLVGVVLVVQGIRDDESISQRVRRIPSRPPQNLKWLKSGGATGREAQTETFYRHQFQLLQQEMDKFLKGSPRKRRTGVILLVVGIVCDFVAGLVALLG